MSSGDIPFNSTNEDAQKLDLDISSSAWPLTFKLILGVLGIGLIGSMCFYGWDVAFDRSYKQDSDPLLSTANPPDITKVAENQLNADDRKIENMASGFGITAIVLNLLIFASPFLFRGNFKLSKTIWRLGMIFSLMVLGFLGASIALTFSQIRKSDYRPTRNLHLIGSVALISSGIVVLSRIARFFTRESLMIVLIFGALSLYVMQSINAGQTGAIVVAGVFIVSLVIANRLPISVELGVATGFLSALSVLTYIWMEATGPISFYVRDDSAFAQSFSSKK